MNRKEQPRYNEQKRSRASITAVLRAIVAFYLAYLGWTIAQNSGGADTTMQPWMGWSICAVFTVAAIGFGVYTMKRYQADLKAAELPEEEDTARPGEADGKDGEDEPSP